jgi:hypothetical protein
MYILQVDIVHVDVMPTLDVTSCLRRIADIGIIDLVFNYSNAIIGVTNIG